MPLAHLAAPGRATQSATSVPAEKPIISSADISAFYTAAAAGKYSQEDFARYEAMIFEAQKDGRITG